MYNWHVVWFMAKTYGYKSAQHKEEIDNMSKRYLRCGYFGCSYCDPDNAYYGEDE